MKRFLLLVLLLGLAGSAHAGPYAHWWQVASAAADVGGASFTVPVTASGSMRVGPYLVYHQGNLSLASSASDILTSLKTVDGAGSGLDADLLDGLHAASFVFLGSYTAADVLAKTLTVDGSGSGLDADLLDGYHSGASGASIQLRTDSGGYLLLDNWIRTGSKGIYSTDSRRFYCTDSTYATWRVEGARSAYTGLEFYCASNVRPTLMYDSSGNGGIFDQSAGAWRWYQLANGNMYIGASSVNLAWHAGNDGSGSGLDADLLDGYHVSTTANAANTVPVRDANGYMQLGWINTTSGDNGTTTPTRIYASDDGYIRYYSLANFKTVLGLTTGGATPYYDTGWQSIGNGGSWSSSAGAVPSDEKNYLVGMYKTSAGSTDIYTLTSRSDIAFRYDSSNGTVTIVNASGGTLYLRAFCYRIP